MAADLVQRQVAVIVTPIGTVTVLAAKTATSTIPIVFSAGTDPVKAGIVASLRRPGGNVTGVNYMAAELSAKRLSLLHELTPRATRIALLVNPANPVPAETVPKDTEAAAETIGLAHPGGNITGFTVDDSALGGKWVELLKQIAPATIRVALLFNPAGPPLEFFLPSIQAAASSLNVQANLVTIHGRDEIEAVIAAQARDPGGGIIALANAFNTTNRELIIELAARYRVPAIYFSAYCAQSGGLIGYGSDYAEQSRQAAGYIDRILKGTKPADLPVQAPTKFELVINLKAAKALGLQVPEKLLALADEVIE